MLDKIKILLNISGNSKDELINEYIKQVKFEIEAYVKREYTPRMDVLTVQMVIEKYNRRFNEGVTTVSTSGVNTTFKDGYSMLIMNQLNAYKKKVSIL